MAILYVAAEAIELEPLAKRLTNLRKLKWPVDYAQEGIWEGRRLMLAANGAGPRLASRAVEIAIRAIAAADLSSSRLETVISTGFCGALDPGLEAQQIVAASAVVDLASGETYPAASVVNLEEGVRTGTVATQDRIAGNAEEKRQLASGGAIAVDMEAAGVAARAKRAGLPFACIKVVSDCAGESFGVDFNRMRSNDGHIRRDKISYYALTHPAVIPELLRWRRRAKAAAEALGEFLVNCRINSEPIRPASE